MCKMRVQSLNSAVTVVLATLVGVSRGQPGPYGAGGHGGWGGNWGGFPSCAQSCSPQYDSDTCPDDAWGSCICTDQTTLVSTNKCVEDSSCSPSDKDSVYSKIASLCAQAGTTLTNAPQASFTTAFPSSWTNTGPWGSGTTGWNGPSPGPWNGNGPDSWTSEKGPWSKGPFGGVGPWTSGPWTEGDWTSWWDGANCPPATWTGWTSDHWSNKPDWTSWKGCTASTTTTVIVTTTNGGVLTTTALGIKVQEQTSGTLNVDSGTPSKTGSFPVTNTPGAGVKTMPKTGALLVILLGLALLL